MPNGITLRQRQRADLSSKVTIMFVVWNRHAAQRTFDVLTAFVYRSQLKIEVAHQLYFTLDALISVSDYFISALVKQGEWSHFCCCNLNFEANRLNRISQRNRAKNVYSPSHVGLGTLTVSVEGGWYACIGSCYLYQTYYWHKQPLVLKLPSLEYRRAKGDMNEIC